MKKTLERFMRENGYKAVSADLFSGPGGIATGFRWAGVLPVVAAEFSETTAQTYADNQDADLFRLDGFRDDPSYADAFMEESARPVLILGDIREVPEGLVLSLLEARYGLSSVDIVSGGAPCESFSYAGRRESGDPRDDLFLNIARLAQALRPKAILFENVKGIFTKRCGPDGERAFSRVCRTFRELEPPYFPAFREPSETLLRACDYGAPQKRERVILAAFRDREAAAAYRRPEPRFGPGRELPFVTAGEAFAGLPEVGSREESSELSPPEGLSPAGAFYLGLMRSDPAAAPGMNLFLPERLGGGKGPMPEDVLPDQRGPGHTERKLALLSLIGKGETMKKAALRLEAEGRLEEVRHLFPKTLYASRNRRIKADEPAFTVTSHCLDEMVHPTLDRAVTVREAARLQSFPDWYEFRGPRCAFHSDPVQDRYEQAGDAVPPLLAHAAAGAILEALGENP